MYLSVHLFINLSICNQIIFSLAVVGGGSWVGGVEVVSTTIEFDICVRDLM